MLAEANLHWRYIDRDIVMPWYTLPCLEWLKTQELQSWSVFEYGGGYSSVWWRDNAVQYNGVDVSPKWANAFGLRLQIDKRKYVQAIGIKIVYDCVVVDGAFRNECIDYAKSRIKPQGFMIVDNYDESKEVDVVEVDISLKGWGKVIYVQENHTFWKTAVFQKP
jgi:hypothetical protein